MLLHSWVHIQSHSHIGQLFLDFLRHCSLDFCCFFAKVFYVNFMRTDDFSLAVIILTESVSLFRFLVKFD